MTALTEWHKKRMEDPAYRRTYEAREPGYKAAHRRLLAGWDPLKTSDEHYYAMREIDKLWGSSGDTEDGRCLSQLFTLVEEFEWLMYPISAPSLWDRFLFYMERRWGISLYGRSR